MLDSLINKRIRPHPDWQKMYEAELEITQQQALSIKHWMCECLKMWKEVVDLNRVVRRKNRQIIKLKELLNGKY